MADNRMDPHTDSGGAILSPCRNPARSPSPLDRSRLACALVGILCLAVLEILQVSCAGKQNAAPGDALFLKAEQSSLAISQQIQDKQTVSRQKSQEELEGSEERNRALAIKQYQSLLAKPERLDPTSYENTLINLGHVLFDQCLADFRKAMRGYNEAYQRSKSGAGPEPALPLYDFSPARQVYEKYLELFPNSSKSPEVIYNLAYSYEEQGDLDRAVSLYDDLALRAPDARFAPEVYMRLGEHHFEMDQFDRALAYYRKAMERRDSQFYDKALFKIGWCYYAQAQLPEAKDAFAQVLEYQSGSPTAKKADLYRECLEILAKIMSETGGARALDSFLVQYRNPPYGLALSLQLGDYFQQTSRYQDAVETYRKLLQSFPLCSEAPFVEQSLIKCLMTERRVAEAEDVQASMMERYGAGTAWERSNPDPELRKQVDSILQDSLDNLILAHHRAARENNDPREYERAIALYQRALHYFPTGEKAYEIRFRYAECLSESGRLEEAAREYEQVSKTESYETYREKAASKRIQCLEQLRQTGKLDTNTLLAAYADYVQMHPENEKTPPLLFKQGEILFNAKRYPEASSQFQRLIRDYPQYADVNRAWVLEMETLFEAGDYQALEQFCLEMRQRALPLSAEQKQRLNHLLCISQFELARQDQDKGNLALAAQRYEQLVEQNPQAEIAPDALFNAAICYRDSSDWPRAAACFEKILARYPGSKHYKDAILAPIPYYEQSAQWDRILSLLDRLYAVDPGNELARESQYKIAKRLYRENQYDLARQTFASYARKYPADASRTLEMSYLDAWITENQGNRPAALAGYRHFLDSYQKAKSAGPTPNVDPEYLARAQFLLLESEYQSYRAVQLREPLKANLTRKETLLDRVEAGYLETAKLGAGEFSLAAAFRVGEAYEDFGKSMLDSQIPDGLSKEELSVYQELLAKQAAPYFEKARNAYGVALDSARSKHLFNSWVMKTYSRLAVLDPEHYPPLEQEAVIWQETWQEKRSLIRTLDLGLPRSFGRSKPAALQKELDGILSDLQEDKQKGEMDRNRITQAIGALSQLASKEPSLFEVYFNLGVLCQMTGESSKAEAAYLNALKQNPNLPLAHLNLGVLYLEQGRPDAAEPHFREMTRLNPSYAGGWYLLGVASSSRGDYANAIAPLEEAIRLLPQFLDPYVQIGWVQTRSGRPEEAEKSYAVVLNHPNASSRLLRKLAWCYLEAGSTAKAIDIYRRVTGSGEVSYEDWNNLGVAYLRQGDVAEAGKALTKAAGLDASRPEAYNNLGLCYQRQQDYGKAGESFLKSSQLAPSYLPPLLNAAVVFGQYQENTEKALELIRKYLSLGGNLQKELLQDWTFEQQPENTTEGA